MRTKVIGLTTGRSGSLHRDWDVSFRKMRLRQINRRLRQGAKRDLRCGREVTPFLSSL